MRSEFSGVFFQDPSEARVRLERLEKRLAPVLINPLASLLSHSPDPDGSLDLLETYAYTASAELLDELSRAPAALTYLVAVFGYSRVLAQTFLAEPDLALQFARDRKFTKLRFAEDLMQDYARFATIIPDPWLSSQLARFSRRNVLRLALKDILGVSTLGETGAELSALADVVLSNALLFCDRELEKRYGQPRYRDAEGRIGVSGFSVMSLGKLGGGELDYSSEIGVMFVYSHDGETSGSSERGSAITNREYFARLSGAITRTITQPTPEGGVFRVDARSRPRGDQNELAVSLASALEYYAHHARDWELQMLIQARHSAGDARLARDFLRGVEPHVYSSQPDCEALERVLWERDRISKRMRESRGIAIDLEYHRGGLRDIEFLTQCLQRLFGGEDRWIRSGGTLLTLRKLNDKGCLSDSDYATLTTAYEFLRKVQHRIQLDLDRESWRLPEDARALDRLARRAAVEAAYGQPPGEILLRRVEEVFRQVDEIYQRVIHPHAGATPGIAFGLRAQAAPPSEQRAPSYESIVHYLHAQAPELAAGLCEFSPSPKARKNVTRFFAALLGSSERFRLARERPELVRRALAVIDHSEHLAELLINHPEDLATLELTTAAPLTEPFRTTTAVQRDMGFEADGYTETFGWVAEGGLSLREEMTLLRREYRTRVLELGASDLMGGESIFSVLARWAALARRSIASAIEIALGDVENSFATLPVSKCPLIVLGIRRLGVEEFDLGSEADLVFMVPSETPSDQAELWTRVAERSIEILSSFTREGALFAVQTQPSGLVAEGKVVVREDALLDCIGTRLVGEEALSYVNATPVAGNLHLARQSVTRVIGCLLDRFAPGPGREGDLRSASRWLKRELAASGAPGQAAPGACRELELAIAFLRLRHRLTFPPGRNLAEQVKALGAAMLMSPQDALRLGERLAFLRSVDHAVQLVTGRDDDGVPQGAGHLETVESLMVRWGLALANASLAQRVRDTLAEARELCLRAIESDEAMSRASKMESV